MWLPEEMIAVSFVVILTVQDNKSKTNSESKTLENVANTLFILVFIYPNEELSFNTCILV